MEPNSKEKAIAIAEQYLFENSVEYMVVDQKGIQESKLIWFISFIPSELVTSILVGGMRGLVIDKFSSDYLEVGSGQSVEEVVKAFKLGIREGRQDLLITKVHDQTKVLQAIKSLDLQFVRIAVEGTTEWKIPRSFTSKMIKERLSKLPCVFKNQSFCYRAKALNYILEHKVFDYQLLEASDEDLGFLGELLVD